MTDQAVLKCSCCDLPFAVVQRGVLVIQSRHHGERHVNVLTLEELRRMLDAAIQTHNERATMPAET
jgi:hypothetical protein